MEAQEELLSMMKTKDRIKRLEHHLVKLRREFVALERRMCLAESTIEYLEHKVIPDATDD
jgi:hypothetical protein